MNDAAMENDPVSDGNTIADASRKLAAGDMNHAVILNVGAVADLYGIDIATQDTVKPYARMLADLHIADNMRAFFDKCSFSYPGLYAFVGSNHKCSRLSKSVIKRSELQWAALQLSIDTSNLY